MVLFSVEILIAAPAGKMGLNKIGKKAANIFRDHP